MQRRSFSPATHLPGNPRRRLRQGSGRNHRQPSEATESALLGVVLDSSAVIAAEGRKQPIAAFIEDILATHGPVDLSLSPVTVAELVHGIYRAQTPEASRRRREYIEELVELLPVHPVTGQTAWLIGEIEGQEAAKGNVLPFNDLMIAAAAIEQGYAVLTGNLRHFSLPSHRRPDKNPKTPRKAGRRGVGDK